MTQKKEQVFICNCENSMPLDAAKLGKSTGLNDLKVYNQLCRRQIDQFEKQLDGNSPVLVACTQEAPIFQDVLSELGSNQEASFFNIREKAGWSKDAKKTTPKIAALIREILLRAPDHDVVSMESNGELIILGNSQIAIDCANKLTNRMNVTVILTGIPDLEPPSVDSYPVFTGRIASARGHMGSFELDLTHVVAADPTSRRSMAFAGLPREETTICDLILDLRGTSLFTASHMRDGYFAPDPSDPSAIAQAMFDLTELIGSFEKPRYVTYNPDICAHSRSQITGCSKCLDNCASGAISSNGDHVNIDPFICAGCGDCAAVCPTGAVSYQIPDGEYLTNRARVLISAYLEAGGTNPEILVHDANYGNEMISMMARHGDGLPANVLPLEVNSIAQAGLDFYLSATAYGADRISILMSPRDLVAHPSCQEILTLANHTLSAMGYGTELIRILDHEDPDQICTDLYQSDKADSRKAANFLPSGNKRTTVYQALGHLNDNAPIPQDVINLPDGAPFGTIHVRTEDCTLCLACVSSCPANALQDSPDKPQLKYTESACVQCGLCVKTCPEKIISLEPRFELTGEARRIQILNEEEPFECISCGKEFGTKSTIDKMIEKLSGHTMFANEEALNRLKMCDDCRVISLSQSAEDPFRMGERPQPRTTDDYLREREAKKATAGES